MGGVTNTLFFRRGNHLKKYKFIGFDVETFGDENLFYMGGVWDENGYKAFYNRYEMVNYLMQYQKATYRIATNLQFDFNALFFGRNMYSDFEIIMRGSDFILCSYKNSKGDTIKFIDTMNYAPFSVAVMGDILKIPKLPKPKCLGRKPQNEEEKKELEEYNKRDCEVTYKFASLLQEGFNELGGSMKLTIASSSLDIFLRKYLRFNLKKEDIIDLDVNEFIFSAYAGGRTEVFKRGKYENLKCYDVNSLYPFVMTQKYPLPASAKYTLSPTEEVLRYMGITECKVKCPKELDYPILWKREEGKLIFPTGEFTGVYTNEEIRKAKQLGYTITLIRSLYYTKTFYPFREYVKDIYAKRMYYKSLNDPREVTAKLSLNSLYGKTAQKEKSKFTYFNMGVAGESDTIWDDNDKNVIFNPHNEVGYVIEKDICSSSFVTPILACYTTAKARLYMYEFIAPYSAHYTDTDSLFTDAVFPTSKELGGLKVEYDTENAIFVKPKMYAVKLIDGSEKIRLKGVPKPSRKQFEEILEGKRVRYIKYSKTKMSIKQNILPNTKEEIIKNISLEDSKRVWEKEFNGLPQTSKPIHLTEET